MHIAIISDTHDNVWKLEKAYPYLKESDAILHCGDIVSPFMIARLAKEIQGIPIHIVWGNNDGDKLALGMAAQKVSDITIHGEFAEFNFNGFKIAINHYPAIGKALAQSQRYNLVCYGHDHTIHDEMIGRTRLVNPGELMGLNGRSTIAILEVEASTISFVDL
ncbi:MAG TPA: metallophosphoesterase [Anaerolineae bacterium]|nr:metallophosphoesterase [Anaerolineae bacterium]